MTIPSPDAPRVVADTAELAARVGDAGEIGAIWSIAEPERGLDANVIALPPGESIGSHRGPALDVLVHVIAGSGTLSTDDGDVPLSPGALVWLPRLTRRGFRAGDGGLRYLTVHQRKPRTPLLG